jgi:hypothetical protein
VTSFKYLNILRKNLMGKVALEEIKEEKRKERKINESNDQ